MPFVSCSSTVSPLSASLRETRAFAPPLASMLAVTWVDGRTVSAKLQISVRNRVRSDRSSAMTWQVNFCASRVVGV